MQAGYAGPLDLLKRDGVDEPDSMISLRQKSLATAYFFKSAIVPNRHNNSHIKEKSILPCTTTCKLVTTHSISVIKGNASALSNLPGKCMRRSE